MTTTTTPSNAHEVAVDTKIAAAYCIKHEAVATAANAAKMVQSLIPTNLLAKVRFESERRPGHMADGTYMSADDVVAALASGKFEVSLAKRHNADDRIARYTSAVAARQIASDNYAAEAKNYGGWSRFFLVVSSVGGHVHSSMDCSTCNNGKDFTDFNWLPELSGLTEADAVASQGAILCTVCYPSAPIHFTNAAELAAQAKADASCKGSLTYNYNRETARTGYAYGNAATCNDCGARVTLTKSDKMRRHNKVAS
jgi:hypothetical protein